MLKSKSSLWKTIGCCVWKTTRLSFKLCMVKRFVTWFSKSLNSPSVSAKLVHALDKMWSGFVPEAEVHWHMKSCLRKNLACCLWSLKWWLCESSWDERALWVIWLHCDGDCFLLGFCIECFVVPHFAASSSLGWKNTSVDGKSMKQGTACSAIPLENLAALLGPSVEEAYDDACFLSLGYGWDCLVSRNFLVSRVRSLCRTKLWVKQEKNAPDHMQLCCRETKRLDIWCSTDRGCDEARQ